MRDLKSKLKSKSCGINLRSARNTKRLPRKVSMLRDGLRKQG